MNNTDAELIKCRSKKELKKALKIFDKALSGDTDACIKIMEIMQDDNKEDMGGETNGKNS